ncbi:MAG TPA: diguanylate cyclase, partial [Acidobacteriota bacterium]|nr:diguanylate cyclase [Acidobacteriota bacterium]
IEAIETEPGTRNPEPGFEAVNPSPIAHPPSPIAHPPSSLPEFPRFSETLKLEPVKPVDAPIEEGLSAIESILQRGKTAKLKPIVPAEGVYSEYVHRIQTEQGDISEAVRAITAPLTLTPQSSQWAEEVAPASESVATGALGRTSEVNVSAPPSAISSETRSATHVSSMSWEASHPINPLHESRLSPEPQPVWTVSFDELESGSLKPADMKEELAGKVAELMTAQELNKTLLAHWNNRFTQVEVSFIKLVVDPFVKYGTAVTPELSKAILSPVADMIETECRTEPKLIAYCGSAEFFIVLPGVTSGEIAEIAERLRSQAESLWLSMPNRESDEWLTVSLGVVTSFPLKSSLDSLLSAVNLALELAKDAGGNRVMISPSPLD